MCSANRFEVSRAKKAKPKKCNDHYSNLGEGGHQDPLIKTQSSLLKNHPKRRSTPNLRNTQGLV